MFFNRQVLPSKAATDSLFTVHKDVSLISEHAYFFLTEPNSSLLAFRYSAFMSLCVILNAIFLVLETVDGPNHYTNRKNMATYKDLPDNEEYNMIQEIIWAPMCADAFIRVVVISVLYLSNSDVLDDFLEDRFKVILVTFDVLSNIPFFIRVSYLYERDGLVLSQPLRLLLRCLDLLSSGKILRASKDIPAVVAIRIALSRSMEHLVLPLFFFLVFNVFFGVVVYFMEPCYDFDSCAWSDLFDACFFSVVTMTTTGYGNQVPLYLPARMISVIIMLFGSLFMSMPLAIIGNEYASAWEAVQEQIEKRAVEVASDDAFATDSIGLHTRTVPVDIGRSLRTQSVGDNERAESDTVDKSVALTPLLDCKRNLEISLLNLRNMTSTARKMNPAMLLAVCELRGWISPLLWNVRTSVAELLGGEARDSRRVSFMRSSFVAMTPNDWEEQVRRMQQSVQDDGCTASELAMNAAYGTVGQAKFETQLPPVNEYVDDPDETSDADENQQKQPVAINTSRHHGAHKLAPRVELSAPTETDPPARSSARSSNPLRQSFWPLEPFKAWIGRKSRQSNQVELAGGSDDVQHVGSAHDFSGDEKGNLDSPESNLSSPSIGDDSPGSWGKTSKVAPIDNRPVPKKGFSKLSSGEFTSSITKTVLHRNQSSTFIIKIAKAAPDIAGMRGDGVEFARNMERAVRNPKSLRTKLWMIMEFPHSSNGARALQIFLLFLIMLSVLMLYTQTLPTFSHYGEDSRLCGKVLQRYCDGKDDMSLDPGCFVYDTIGPTSQKLKFDCTTSDCFGHGVNYGARYTNATCKNNDRPFETQDELILNYRAPDFVVSRDMMHRIQDVCQRIECNPDADQIVDGNAGWIPVETFINMSFTIEIILRIFISSSVYGFFMDFMNIFDILSVVPFYVDVAESLSGGNVDMNFAILASSPEPILLVGLKSMKVFRLFKMTRHFNASQVLVATANKAWRQIVGILSLLFFIVAVFSLLLYEVEKGEDCYVGDVDCKVPDDVAPTVKPGQLIYVDKFGELSKFGNVLDSLWFSIVTLTSVGYGDIAPATNLGQLMTVFLMLFGAIYLSMPLTVAATTFWDVHQSYLEKQKKKKKNASKKIMDAVFIKRMKSLEMSLLVVSKKLDTFFHDIQEPTEGEHRLTFLEKCKDIEATLTRTLTHHDPDLRRLSVAISSRRNRSLSCSSIADYDNHNSY